MCSADLGRAACPCLPVRRLAAREDRAATDERRSCHAARRLRSQRDTAMRVCRARNEPLSGRDEEGPGEKTQHTLCAGWCQLKGKQSGKLYFQIKILFILG